MEESHYVIEKLGEYHRLLIQLQEAMPVKRKVVETYRQSSQIQSAKEAYLEPGCYMVPDVPKRVDLFKGAVFNLGELQRQMAKSNSLEVLFEKSRIDAMEKRPLLPLNIGQIGLIGGSGLMNGYVDCKHPHVVKGRIVKEVKISEDAELGTLTEIRVNRMRFHILTPDGVKRLA